jgi:hypothetical protein
VCNDIVKNGSETDVDCGGTCPLKCADGKACSTTPDCALASACVTSVCTATTPSSCSDLHTSHPEAPDGVYTIDPDGAGGVAAYDVYCDMTNDGGGWTLALKADGAQLTFTYADPLWENTVLLNANQPGFDTNEAKLQSFVNVPFTNIRAIMVTAGVSRAVVIPRTATSLQALFSGASSVTTVGRTGWLNMVTGSALQANCNAEGFNASVVGSVSVRIGILGNQENDCGTPESWLGIGGAGAPCDVTLATYASVGNIATCNTVATGGPTGTTGSDVAIRSFGYVMVR